MYLKNNFHSYKVEIYKNFNSSIVCTSFSGCDEHCISSFTASSIFMSYIRCQLYKKKFLWGKFSYMVTVHRTTTAKIYSNSHGFVEPWSLTQECRCNESKEEILVCWLSTYSLTTWEFHWEDSSIATWKCIIID